jgi:DNA-binding transcriptional LysR family regulator
MSILLEAVEARSFSAAARKLGMPLTSVSRKVSELEAHLKTRLLIRSTKRLALTDAGRAYVVACRRILVDISEAERSAAGEYAAPRGDLVMTAPIVFGRLHVLPIVTDFLSAFPEVNVQLVLSDQFVHLLDDNVDVAVRIGPLDDSTLVALRVGTVTRVVCASPGYVARRGIPASPHDLSEHDCVNFVGSAAGATWTFASGKSETVMPVRSRLSVTTAEAAIDAAVAGVGVTRVFSYQVATAVREGRLVPMLRSFETKAWPVSLIHAGQLPLPLKLRAFLDFAGSRLKQRLLECTV